MVCRLNVMQMVEFQPVVDAAGRTTFPKPRYYLNTIRSVVVDQMLVAVLCNNGDGWWWTQTKTTCILVVSDGRSVMMIATTHLESITSAAAAQMLLLLLLMMVTTATIFGRTTRRNGRWNFWFDNASFLLKLWKRVWGVVMARRSLCGDGYLFRRFADRYRRYLFSCWSYGVMWIMIIVRLSPSWYTKGAAWKMLVKS